MNLPVVQLMVVLGNTYDSHDHNHRRKVIDPKRVEKTLKESIQSNNRLKLTSLSDVPQIPQDLHSIHCQRYFFTDNIIVGVNCKQDGCADRPQSEHDTRSSASCVFLFSFESPKQKSQ